MYRLGLLVENQGEELRRLLDNDEASEQDREEDPRTWHRLAAKAGNVEAMVRLAWLLESFPHC